MLPDDQQRKVERAEKILGYSFTNKQYLLSAITHPSASEGRAIQYSYERLEFLGDSILGALVASKAFNTYREMDEGGLTRIKVSLVSGTTLARIAEELGFADVIVFGSSEVGTGKRGLHSALENVYEAVVGALYLDGGAEAANAFVERTLIPSMLPELALEPENPKSALQERMQEDGITPTYKLIETQGPPHDRTFVAQVFAGSVGLAQGMGRTKKEAESKAAKTTLTHLPEFLELINSEDQAEGGSSKKRAKAEKAARNKAAKAAKSTKAGKEPEKKKAKASKVAAKAGDMARKMLFRDETKRRRRDDGASEPLEGEIIENEFIDKQAIEEQVIVGGALEFAEEQVASRENVVADIVSEHVVADDAVSDSAESCRANERGE